MKINQIKPVKSNGENFVDCVKICCRSETGGSGYVHFHRDKKTAIGGPDGGDGGRGGHIIITRQQTTLTLLHLKYRKHILTEAGQKEVMHFVPEQMARMKY